MAKVLQSLISKDRMYYAPSRLVVAFLLVFTSLTSGRTPSSFAADFRHAKQIYVPPSLIPRRLDSEMMRAQEASPYASSPYLPKVTRTYSRRANHMTLPAGKQGTGKITRAKPSIAPIQTDIQALMRKGQLEDVERILKSQLIARPDDEILNAQLAKVIDLKAGKYLDANELEAAMRTAYEALLLKPGDSTAYSVLNESLKRKGINPNDAGERLKLADSLSAQGRVKEAQVEYQISLKIKPTAQAYIGLGNLFMRANKKQEAKTEFQQALETDPNCPAAYRQLGIAKYLLNDAVGANGDLSRALILNRNDEIASRYLIDLWQRQVSKHPGQANAHLGLARAYQLSGNLLSAQCEYIQVVRIDPAHPNLKVARQSFKLDLARQEALRAIYAAKTFESRGAINEAYQKALEAVGLCPKSVDMRLHLAQLCQKLNLTSQARDHYMLVLRDDPKNEEATQHLSSLEMSLPAPTSAPQPAPSLAPKIVPVHDFGTSTPPPASEEDKSTQDRSANPSMDNPTAEMTDTSRISTTAHVNSISNFLISLRNLSMAQREQIQQETEDRRKMLKTIFTVAPPEASGLTTPVKTPPAIFPVSAPLKNSVTANSHMIVDPPSSNDDSQAQLRPPIREAISTASSYAKSEFVRVESSTDARSDKERGAVKFELEGAKVNCGDIELKVVLKNEQERLFFLPRKTQAVIKVTGQKDRLVEVMFPSNQIPSGGHLHGTVRVPVQAFTSKADCYLPKILPVSAGEHGNLHLTVPVSALHPEHIEEL